jgi:hypothetical protein
MFVRSIQPVMLGGIPGFKVFINTLFSMAFIVMNTQYKDSLINLCQAVHLTVQCDLNI